MATQKTTKHPGLQTLSWEEVGIAAPRTIASPKDFAIWVRALLQNWRQGTVGVKGRADVSLTGKKPWKQKGTGRARAGTARSPLWRGGGVTFGPQKRVKTLKISAEKRKNILLSMLADFLNTGRFLMLDWELPTEKPKTAEAFKKLKELGLENKRILLLVPMQDEKTHASFSNLKNVRVSFFDQLNAYDLAQSDVVLFLKKDLDSFKEVVKRWT